MADEQTIDVAEPASEAPDTVESSARVQEILSEMGTTPGKGEDSVELFGQDGVEESVEPSSEPQVIKEEKVTAPPKRTSTLQKLIEEKFKGDEEALVKSLIEQQNAASDMRGELNELKELLSTFRKEKEEPGVDPADSDPDVQYWNEQKSMLDQEMQRLSTRRSWLADEYDKASVVAAKIEGKMEIADEFDKSEFEKELNQIKQYLANLTNEWNDIPRFEKKLTLDAKELERRVEAAKRDAHSKVQTQKALEVQKAAERQAFRSELLTLIDSVATQNSIGQDSKQYRTLKKHIWNDIFTTVSGMDPDGPGVNLQEAVVQAATEYFEAIGQQNRANFLSQSQQKIAATSPRTPTPIIRPPGNSKVVPKGAISPEMARRHAKAVLGG